MKSEAVLDALRDQIDGWLQAHPVSGGAVTVERNIDIPAEIPAGGLIVIRDGDPGDPDQDCNRLGPAIYSHTVDIEVCVQHVDNNTRNAMFAELITAIGAAFESDRTLGGNADGMTYGAGQTSTLSIEGAAGVKCTMIHPVIDYQAPTALG